MSSGCGEFLCVCAGVCLDREVQCESEIPLPQWEVPGGWQYSRALGSMARGLEQGRDNVSYTGMGFHFESSGLGKGCTERGPGPRKEPEHTIGAGVKLL